MRVEVISYLGLLVQFSPAAGRAGCCRQMSLCMGSTRRVLARQPEVLAPSPRCGTRFPPSGGQPRRPEVWAASPRVRRAFSLRSPSSPRQWGLRKSLDRNLRLFAGWEGVASLGLSLPLSPPPASFLQRGWAGSSLQFLSPLVLRTA